MSNDDEVGDFRKYKDKINYQIALESVFIALINQHATITIKRRSVKTSVTLPYLCITEIMFNDTDIVFLEDLVQNRVKLEYDTDLVNGTKETTAYSRLKKKRIIIALELLEDILFELGYRFNYVYLRRKNKSIAGEIVDEIVKNENVSYSDVFIKKVGVKINAYLYDVIEKSTILVLEKNNPLLQQFLEETE